MKISYKHLVKHIQSDPSIEDVSKNLFQLGHEHEVENNIFDIEFTPNRGDCLSLNGLLRDLKVFYEIDYIQEIHKQEINSFDFNFQNLAVDQCSNISFLRIDLENLDVRSYTGPLGDYYKDLCINKNNFFTDVSNFISYETGQPTHCYDFNKLGSSLTLNTIDGEHTFKTLLGNTINLRGSNLVFHQNNKIINLAGVIGGIDTACSEKTSSVVIECANFKPKSIIGKSVLYDIQSEAAHKFERGVDSLNHDYVLRRFIKIVKDHSSVKNIELFTKNYVQYEPKKINLDTKSINNILGINIKDNDCASILLKLGFEIDNNTIIIPSYRNDISTVNDIAEEIARSYGYDNIERKSLKILDELNSKPNLNSKEFIIKSLLVDAGFYEVINNPFVSMNSKNAIILDNPLDMNKKYIRTDLKSSLINNLLYNERRQQDSVKLFELSDLYNSTDHINKKRTIGIIASGRVGKNYKDFSKIINKRYIEKILNEYISTSEIKFENINRNTLDSKLKNDIIYVELDLTDIKLINNNIIPSSNPPVDFIKYKPISEYPSSSRDLSFLIKNTDSLDNLENIILSFKDKLLKESFVFDFYNNFSKGEIKIAFRFIFQATDRTITEEDVNKIMKQIIQIGTQIETVSIPGLKDDK